MFIKKSLNELERLMNSAPNRVRAVIAIILIQFGYLFVMVTVPLHPFKEFALTCWEAWGSFTKDYLGGMRDACIVLSTGHLIGEVDRKNARDDWELGS